MAEIEIPPCPLEENPSDGYSSNLPSGLNVASKDKFLLVFELPKVLRRIDVPYSRDENGVDKNTVSYKIYGFKVPKINVPSIKVPFGGYVGKLSSHSRPEYEAVSINFTIDSGFQNYHTLYKWLNVLSGDKGKNYNPDNLSTSPGKLCDYTTIISLYALDEYDRVIAEFIFTGAFIVELGGIEYNYRTEKEMESYFSFEFTFMEMKLIEEPYSIHTII